MSLPIQHLRLRLRPIHRALRAAARRQADELSRIGRPDSPPTFISSELVALRLAALDHMVATGRTHAEGIALTTAEEAEEAALRQTARTSGRRLPLDRIAVESRLDRFDLEALLTCTAAEIDPRYGAVVAFIMDDSTSLHPNVHFLASLTATTLSERLARREALGPDGRLRRCGLLRSGGMSTSGGEEVLAVTPRALRALTGADESPFVDPSEAPAGTCMLPEGSDPECVRRLGGAMRDNDVEVVGVWGPRQSEHAQVVHALARCQQRQVRRLGTIDPRQPALEQMRVLTDALDSAMVLDNLCWIDTDALDPTVFSAEFADALARSRARICLSGVHPFRPSAMLAARSYAEMTLSAPTYAARLRNWSAVLPELAPSLVADLAARYRLDTEQLAAVANTARTAARVAQNGHVPPVADFVEPACAQLVQKRSHRFARVTTPRRGIDDLVLAPDLHRQVLDVAHAFRVWPRVADAWGLGPVASGGLKALFTGEPGTGKTLAAEVIASQLGLPLVKIDLAQIVSKWVGETEKNLEAAFRESEDGNAVLFFDEAEALFGKRGEVRHGTDRYANLEISYLLQRLEEHDGLVILASNLKDEIDHAFTRRFHALVHFPRPAEAERRRLWRLALPESVPLEDGVDLALLAKLDLTGAGIVAAARTAALHAAQAGTERIGPAHLVMGVARQFQRESRLLTPTDLGPYAAFLRHAR